MLRMSLIHVVSALLAALFTAGCANQPGAFRLTAPSAQAILLPPDAKDVSVVRATLRIGPLPRKTVCPPSPHGLLIQRKWLAGPRVVVTRDAIGSTTGPELFAWTVELEKQGCIPANGALSLSERVIDALPLDLAQRSRLLQGRGDLTNVNSLRVVSPIYKAGESATAGEITSISQGGSPNSLSVDVTDSHITGYEIDWYDLQARASEPGYRVVPGYPVVPGYRVVPRSAEVHLDGAVEHPPAPATSRFQADPQARWHQLFMMTKVSENDFDFVVLSARTSAALLDDATAFQRDSAAFLETADPSSYTLLPHGTGINAYVRVKINGAPVDLLRGSAVRQALLQASANLRTAPPNLKIRKLHNGRLYPVEWDPKSDQILSLPLEGGEEIDF